MQKIENNGPLSGLNVLDFGHYYAGPMVAMLLADQGANVIRIVKPGRPELQEQQYRLLNRNKRLLEIELKTEEGKSQALSLIECADIVIENFRPGVMKRLGLDYANIKNCNPALVYLSLPGFASTDKERASIQAWEGILSAAIGVYTMGFNQVMGFPPVYSSIPQCSSNGGITGAIAVMAALAAREQHGYGTQLEVPLVDAGLQGRFEAIVSSSFAGVERPHPFNQPSSAIIKLDDLKYTPDATEADNLRNLGEAFWSRIMMTGYQPFECADGRQVFAWAQDLSALSCAYYQALGIERQLLDEGFVYAGTWEFGRDNNLNCPAVLSSERSLRLKDLLTDTFKSKSALEWENILREAGQCCGVVRSRDEFLAMPQMQDAGVLAKMDDGKNKITVPARLVDISGPEDSLYQPMFKEKEKTSYLGALEWFQQYFHPPARSERLPSQHKGDLLQGLKVLELGSFVSAPYASGILAQFGAEVIKSDETIVLPLFLWHPLGHSQGKRSLIASLKGTEGQKILRKLVKQSDLVLHNIRDEAAERLGISHAQLHQINPNVVSSQICGLGGTYRDFFENYRGIEPVAPCITGLWAHYGSVETPILHGGTDSSDIPGGLALAFASLVAIYQQRKTGCAGEARASLVRGTCYYQLPWMIAEHGSSQWGQAGGQFARGDSPWQQLYQCEDGWIFVGTTEDQFGHLSQVVSGCEQANEQTIKTAFLQRGRDYWYVLLNELGIGCYPVETTATLCTRDTKDVDNTPEEVPAGASWEVMRYINHPGKVPINIQAPSTIRVGENHSFKRLAPWQGYGHHSQEILAELGYTCAEIEKLMDQKVVCEYLPEMGNRDDYYFNHNQ